MLLLRRPQNPRILRLATKSMSAEITVDDWQTQPAKVTSFAGGNEGDVRRNRLLRFRPVN
jgi:hypothetical protein